MSTGGAFSGTTSGTTRDSQGGVFNNVNSSVPADAGAGSGNNAEILALIAAEAATRLANDNTEIGLRTAADDLEIAARMAADAVQDTEIATKQDQLIAGTNITLTPLGDNTTRIVAAGGGGSAPITTQYTLRLDFNTGAQPTIVVNTGVVTPVVDYNADSILSSELPDEADVNVNGIPFIINTDYTIGGGVLNFVAYDIVANDGDVIVISATIVS